MPTSCGVVWGFFLQCKLSYQGETITFTHYLNRRHRADIGGKYLVKSRSTTQLEIDFRRRIVMLRLLFPMFHMEGGCASVIIKTPHPTRDWNSFGKHFTSLLCVDGVENMCKWFNFRINLLSQHMNYDAYNFHASSYAQPLVWWICFCQMRSCWFISASHQHLASLEELI